MSDAVIVFGPTGNVGSVVARTAQRLGPKVFLAMRDTSKAIPGLDEKQGGFERVQADLGQPDSVAAAVKHSGAKRAFFYLNHHTRDHMRSVVEALKTAGIDFVVFLSSFTISGELDQVPQRDVIPFVHARVEMVLEEIFKDGNYVALRPGFFATNSLGVKKDLPSGEVKIHCPGARWDYISPSDMGRVGGTILAKGPQAGQKHVYLFGPQIISQKEATETIAKVLGKHVTVTGLSDEQVAEQHKQFGMPPPFSDYLIRHARENDSGTLKSSINDPTLLKEGQSNCQNITGEPPQGFEDFVKSYRDQF